MTRFLRTSVWVAGFALVVLGTSTTAKADSVPTVTYTVSGSTGDWTLDFTVTDNTDQNVYFFGVLLPTDDQTGTPTGWQVDGDFNPSSFGGTNTNYNNVWISSNTGVGDLTSGHSLSGFDAVDTSVTAPTSVKFFAFACDSTFLPSNPECGGSAYTGGGNFDGTHNPGFEGMATNGSAAPEPRWAGVLLLMACAGLMVGRNRVHRSLARSSS
jgi:hypothetical protein